MSKLMPVMYSQQQESKHYVSYTNLSNDHALSTHSQSLDRLRERGGMSPAEILANIYGLSPFAYLEYSDELLANKLSEYLTLNPPQ